MLVRQTFQGIASYFVTPAFSELCVTIRELEQNHIENKANVTSLFIHPEDVPKFFSGMTHAWIKSSVNPPPVVGIRLRIQTRAGRTVLCDVLLRVALPHPNNSYLGVRITPLEPTDGDQSAQQRGNTGPSGSGVTREGGSDSGGICVPFAATSSGSPGLFPQLAHLPPVAIVPKQEHLQAPPADALETDYPPAEQVTDLVDADLLGLVMNTVQQPPPSAGGGTDMGMFANLMNLPPGLFTMPSFVMLQNMVASPSSGGEDANVEQHLAAQQNAMWQPPSYLSQPHPGQLSHQSLPLQPLQHQHQYQHQLVHPMVHQQQQQHPHQQQQQHQHQQQHPHQQQQQPERQQEHPHLHQQQQPRRHQQQHQHQQPQRQQAQPPFIPPQHQPMLLPQQQQQQQQHQQLLLQLQMEQQQQMEQVPDQSWDTSTTWDIAYTAPWQ